MQPNQSFGPLNQDNVKNSGEFNQRRNSKQNYKHYKSPSRTAYQQRYPASLGIQQDNNPIRVKITPPKYNQPNNNFNRSKSPGVSQVSVSMGSYSQYADKGYTSPNRPSFIQSPYANNYQSNQNNYQTPYGNNYQSSPNNYQSSAISPNYGMNKMINNWQQSNIKQRSIIQLQKVVSQLKLSLQQSLSSQQSLQQQLNKQRGRSFQMSQMKRKLQQELSRMQFELERITNGDLLGQRELMIKYQNEVKQNERLNSQINQVRQQLRKLRKQHRQVVTQTNQLKQQNQLLHNDNIQLINKMQQLTQHINQIQQQYNLSMVNQNQLKQQNDRLKHYQRQSIRLSQQNNTFAYNNIKSQQSIMRSQQSINNQAASIGNYNNHIPSIANINNINTTRSNNYDSYMYGKNNNNTNMNNTNMNNVNINDPQQQQQLNYMMNKNKPQSPVFSPQQQQQINYDYQNSKLIQDYNKLMTENQSMKKLYQEFYQPSQQNIHSLSPNNLAQYQIGQEDQELEQTKQQFYNHNHKKHNQEGNNYQQYQQYKYQPSSQQQQQSERLRTFQKTHLYQQVTSFRQQIIQSLIQNYYSLAVTQAQKQKANVLVIFIKTINRNLPTIEKMVINYLQARDIMKRQLENNKLKDLDQNNQPQTQYQQQAQQLWLNTKQKLKLQLKAHSLPNNNTLNKNQIITLNINAYYLALFRLLTLIHKYQNNTIHSQSNTLTKIKHQALKYIHKIYQQTTKIKNNNK